MRPSGVPAAIQPRSRSLPRASRPERPAQRADRALVGGAAAADDRFEPRRADAARPLPRERVGKAALVADALPAALGRVPGTPVVGVQHHPGERALGRRREQHIKQLVHDRRRHAVGAEQAARGPPCRKSGAARGDRVGDRGAVGEVAAVAALEGEPRRHLAPPRLRQQREDRPHLRHAGQRLKGEAVGAARGIRRQQPREPRAVPLPQFRLAKCVVAAVL
mmetsp:Transcript_10453/g.33106  ORF Transcript_10453/g.33106 Transcript_10453/m.33106 type:complete len:221 (+) Transcript_10453:144-806(+)